MIQGYAPKPTRLKALACNTNAQEVDVGELAVDRFLLGEHQRGTQIAAIGGWLVIGDVVEVLNDLEPNLAPHQRVAAEKIQHLVVERHAELLDRVAFAKALDDHIRDEILHEGRSERRTSELQSLRRKPQSVVCLN